MYSMKHFSTLPAACTPAGSQANTCKYGRFRENQLLFGLRRQHLEQGSTAQIHGKCCLVKIAEPSRALSLAPLRMSHCHNYSSLQSPMAHKQIFQVGKETTESSLLKPPQKGTTCMCPGPESKQTSKQHGRSRAWLRSVNNIQVSRQ